MKNTAITKTPDMALHAGLRLMRVRADFSCPEQPGMGGATVLTNGRLSGIPAVARTRPGVLETAIARYRNRCGTGQAPADLERARVGWIAGDLHLFADSELEVLA